MEILPLVEAVGVIMEIPPLVEAAVEVIIAEVAEGVSDKGLTSLYIST